MNQQEIFTYIQKQYPTRKNNFHGGSGRAGHDRKLQRNVAPVIVIERDLDVMKNADYMIDMGPGDGDAGGTIVAAGTPEDIMASEQMIT